MYVCIHTCIHAYVCMHAVRMIQNFYLLRHDVCGSLLSSVLTGIYKGSQPQLAGVHLECCHVIFIVLLERAKCLCQ